MRINKYIALSTGMSRRDADSVIEKGNVRVNGELVTSGVDVGDQDVVFLGERRVRPASTHTIMFNKPAGYIVSRDGQGGKTIYDILPAKYHALKPIGRLDKYSSGLLLLTNDGELANTLTHPSQQKIKEYKVSLGTPLQPLHRQMISDYGVQLEDGRSKLELERVVEKSDKHWIVRMHEGRNRQIRRTFDSLGYSVNALHRTSFGPYTLDDLPEGSFKSV